MFILQLNDMRDSNVENLIAVARAETKEDLERFMESHKVEGYRDGQWFKTYQQGCPLEWYNPPYTTRVPAKKCLLMPSSFDSNIIDVGSADKWARNARKQFEEQVMRLPQLKGLNH